MKTQHEIGQLILTIDTLFFYKLTFSKLVSYRYFKSYTIFISNIKTLHILNRCGSQSRKSKSYRKV